MRQTLIFWLLSRWIVSFHFIGLSKVPQTSFEASILNLEATDDSKNITNGSKKVSHSLKHTLFPTGQLIFLPLSSEFGTDKTDKARFCRCFSGKRPENLSTWSIESGEKVCCAGRMGAGLGGAAVDKNLIPLWKPASFTFCTRASCFTDLILDHFTSNFSSFYF